MIDLYWTDCLTLACREHADPGDDLADPLELRQLADGGEEIGCYDCYLLGRNASLLMDPKALAAEVVVELRRLLAR